MRTMNLICSVCGGNAPAKKQWWNRDDGYGVCPKCYRFVVGKEGEHAALRYYGEPGVHHSIYKTMFAVTHVDADGLRVLTLANQGRSHFETQAQAQANLDALRPGLTEKILGKMAATLAVRAVECYANGDATGIYVDP